VEDEELNKQEKMQLITGLCSNMIFFLNFNRRVLGRDRIKLFVGIGYLLNINKVKIPLNMEYFTEPGLDPLLILIFNKRYFKHNLHFPIEGRYHIKNDKMKSFAITIGILNNITVF
jgi:hypothetical protein